MSLLKRVLVRRGPARTFLRSAARLLQRPCSRQVAVDGSLLSPGTLDRWLSLRARAAGLSETAELALLGRVLRPGMTAVDIGANIGFYALAMARRVGPSGRVFAFEPEPGNFRLLEANLRENGAAQASALRRGVADKTGPSTLYVCEENRGDHMLFNPGGWEGEVVDLVALDDYFAPGERVDFMKLDIQGAEVLAFRGMKRLLSENPGVSLLCEFCPELLALAGHDPRALPNLWAEHGLISRRVESPETPLDPNPDSLLRLGRREGWLNLFLRRAAPPS